MRARWARAALAAGSGLTLAAAAEPWGSSLSAFMATGLLYGALRGATPWVAGGLGLLAGSAANAFALGSVVGLLQDFARFGLAAALPTALLCWIAQAIPWAAAGASARWLERRWRAPLWLGLPCAATFWWGALPMLFPWRPAVALLSWPPWVQLAELGGAPLLDWALWQVGCGGWACAAQPAVRKAAGATALGLLCALPTYGAWRAAAVEQARERAPTARLGVVQPNVGIHEKHRADKAAAILRRLQEASARLEARGAEATFWPETAYPYPIARGRRHDGSAGRGRAARSAALTRPLVIGAVTYDASTEPPRKWNSALVVERDGRYAGRVDKQRLLWFGEVVPLWHQLEVLQARFRSPGFTAGEVGVLAVAGTRAGLLICYEDLFPALARRLVAQGADVLVNLTNNAWFGRTSTSHLHDLAARLRAVETRRDLVRVVNTGISSVTSASGAVQTRTESFQAAEVLAEVRLLRGRSPYSLLGDWVTPLSALAAGLLGLGARRRWLSGCGTPERSAARRSGTCAARFRAPPHAAAVGRPRRCARHGSGW